MTQYSGNHIRLFKTHADYEAAKAQYEEPWLCYVIEDSETYYNTFVPPVELTISGPSTASSEGGEYTLTITSNTSWSVETENGTLTPETGTGNGSVTLELDPIEEEESEIEIIISALTNPGGVLMDTHTIIQGGEEPGPSDGISVETRTIPREQWAFDDGIFYAGDASSWSDICQVSNQVWDDAVQSGTLPSNDGVGYKIKRVEEEGEDDKIYLACLYLDSEDNLIYLKILVYEESECTYNLIDLINQDQVSSSDPLYIGEEGRYIAESGQ